jgi:glucose-fructose oxidoreductase
MSTPHPSSRGRPVSRRRFLGNLSLGAVAMLALPKRGFAAEPPARKLGVALVGLGGYSTGQLGPALRMTKLCHLAGVVTGSPDKGRKWAHSYGFPGRNIYGYDTMTRIADNPDIDIVYVVTPNGLHAEHAIAAAKAGKHVICEKPFTTSVADAERVLAAFREAKIRHSIGYRLHFDPYHQEMMRLARGDDFGPFMKMNGRFAFMMNGRPWRATRQLAGGGPLMDLGIYLIQAGCMAANGVAPVAVTAREGPKTRPQIFQDVEETISWTMEFPNGALCEGYTSYQGSANQFRAEAAKGWIEFSTAFIYNNLAARTSRGPLHFDRNFNQQAAQMDDFARCILDNKPTRVPGEMGLRDMKIIAAIYEAASTGKRVEVKT